MIKKTFFVLALLFLFFFPFANSTKSSEKYNIQKENKIPFPLESVLALLRSCLVTLKGEEEKRKEEEIGTEMKNGKKTKRRVGRKVRKQRESLRLRLTDREKPERFSTSFYPSVCGHPLV